MIKSNTMRTLGTSTYDMESRQEDDYYATSPIAINELLKVENFNRCVWECACGGGHLSEELNKSGYNVFSSDFVDRGYKGTEIIDFLMYQGEVFKGDIITNPPYKQAKEFILKALDLIPKGNKVAMFLKVQFLEGKSRKKLFEDYPPKTIYVSSSRIQCAINGDFKNTGQSAVAYAWYIWEKGYKGDIILKHFN